jgi:hypothetical protein
MCMYQSASVQTARLTTIWIVVACYYKNMVFLLCYHQGRECSNFKCGGCQKPPRRLIDIAAFRVQTQQTRKLVRIKEWFRARSN